MCSLGSVLIWALNSKLFCLPLPQVVARTEKDSHIVAFSHELVPCPVTADMTLPQVLVKMYEVCKTKLK